MLLLVGCEWPTLPFYLYINLSLNLGQPATRWACCISVWRLGKECKGSNCLVSKLADLYLEGDSIIYATLLFTLLYIHSFINLTERSPPEINSCPGDHAENIGDLRYVNANWTENDIFGAAGSTSQNQRPRKSYGVLQVV